MMLRRIDEIMEMNRIVSVYAAMPPIVAASRWSHWFCNAASKILRRGLECVSDLRSPGMARLQIDGGRNLTGDLRYAEVDVDLVLRAGHNARAIGQRGGNVESWETKRVMRLHRGF
jgi:hypothetical protein